MVAVLDISFSAIIFSFEKSLIFFSLSLMMFTCSAFLNFLLFQVYILKQVFVLHPPNHQEPYQFLLFFISILSLILYELYIYTF
jgi:hypothetical protein